MILVAGYARTVAWFFMKKFFSISPTLLPTGVAAKEDKFQVSL